jgi:hypothetical protein
MKEWHACKACGTTSTEVHHIFGGANRKHSDRHGLVIRLCRDCHERMHKDMAFAEKYKKLAQMKFEKLHGHEEFMKVFGRNYLEEI